MRLDKTTKDLIAFVNNSMLVEKQDTKVGKIIKKQCNIIRKSLGDFFDKFEDLKIQNCAENPDKTLIRTDKGDYTFTREGEAALKIGIKELHKEMVNVEIFIQSIDFESSNLDPNLIAYYTEFLTLPETQDTEFLTLPETQENVEG